MSCYKCGGDLEDTTVEFAALNATPSLLVANVPAEACVSCGERIYSNETLDVLEKLRTGLAAVARPKILLEYDYPEALAATRANSRAEIR